MATQVPLHQIPHAEVWTPTRSLLHENLLVSIRDSLDTYRLVNTAEKRQETCAIRKMWKRMKILQENKHQFDSPLMNYKQLLKAKDSSKQERLPSAVTAYPVSTTRISTPNSRRLHTHQEGRKLREDETPRGSISQVTKGQPQTLTKDWLYEIKKHPSKRYNYTMKLEINPDILRVKRDLDAKLSAKKSPRAIFYYTGSHNAILQHRKR